MAVELNKNLNLRDTQLMYTIYVMGKQEDVNTCSKEHPCILLKYSHLAKYCNDCGSQTIFHDTSIMFTHKIGSNVK